MSLTDKLNAVFRDFGWTARPTASQTRAIAITKGTVSFQTLQTCYERCKAEAGETKLEVLLSSSSQDLLMSVNAGAKRGRPSEAEQPKNVADLRDSVANAVKKLEKLSAPPSSEELKTAQSVVESIVCVLRAADGDELACQSFGLFYRKLSPSDTKPRVVLAFRLHAGTPVRVHDLRSCLQTTWSDGAITIEDTLHSVDSVALPLTSEGQLSLEHGNRPILIVTSVSPPT
jgi:hypothetical protein